MLLFGIRMACRERQLVLAVRARMERPRLRMALASAEIGGPVAPKKT